MAERLGIAVASSTPAQRRLAYESFTTGLKARAASMPAYEDAVSLTAVMEPPMFGVMEPQTVAKTTPRRGLNNGGFCLFFGDGLA